MGLLVLNRKICFKCCHTMLTLAELRYKTREIKLYK